MNNNLEWCCKKQIKQLYNDIKYKEYFEPLQRFSKENNNIFNNYLEKKIINDYVIQYYIKSFNNISILIIYPKAVQNTVIFNKMINKLEEHGDIHYIKNIDIDYFMAYNLIFQLYASEKRMKNNSDIIYKINRLGFVNDNSTKQIQIIVYTLLNNNLSINGSSSNFKMELRNLFVQEDIKTTKYNNTDDEYPRGYDYLHISDDINQSYEYAGLFFHENSLKFLKRQKSWRILNSETKKLFDKLKNFMYDYSQKELEKLIIFSSGVLFSYGVREAKDLDCLLLENNIINPKLVDELNKDQDIDLSYKGTLLYNKIWDDELNKRAVIFGATNYNELVIDPKYYYYFMGLKIIRLKCDLYLRFNRIRPAQMTDLIIIRQMFNFGYKLKIPEKTIEYNKITNNDDITIVNKIKYLQTVKNNLILKYYINLSIEQIEEWINYSYKENNIFSNDNFEYYSDLKFNGGFNKLDIENVDNNIIFFDKIKNIANDKYIYPTQMEIIKLGYSPNIIIYSSDKPYLYPGEDFSKYSNLLCNLKYLDIKSKNDCLRVVTFNVHNFISRCNQGIAPIFGTALNPFDKPRDIKKWIKLFKTVDADILCLQELVPITDMDINEDITDLEYIRNNFNFEYFNKQMELLGYTYKIIASTQQGNVYKHSINDYYFLANAIYSKIEFNNEETYQYKYLNRNIITINITFNNKNIQIFNTHFEYYYKPKDTDTHDIILQQFYNFNDIINSYNNNNIIICGDFNINLYKKNNYNPRYKNWENKTTFLRNNYINTNKTKIPTNFSQNDQTDFILYNKNAKLKNVYSFTVITNISDHYMIIADFI